MFLCITAARVYWGGMAAEVIMWDLGASNGVVHIIDNFLSDHTDLNRDISAGSHLAANSVFFGSMSLLVALLLRCLV